MGNILIPACRNANGNCYSCGYADTCRKWLDEEPYTAAKVNVRAAVLALCEGRHEMPEEVEGSIFPNTIDPTDILKIKVIAKRKLDKAVKEEGIKFLVLYVTGLSVALVECINWCAQNDVHLKLMHYNKVTDSYYGQWVE